MDPDGLKQTVGGKHITEADSQTRGEEKKSLAKFCPTLPCREIPCVRRDYSERVTVRVGTYLLEYILLLLASSTSL